MLVSAVSPCTPIHWIVIVVVGSCCQVRNRVLGWKAASSKERFGGAGSAPYACEAASPNNEEPKKARREALMAVAGWRGAKYARRASAEFILIDSRLRRSMEN